MINLRSNNDGDLFRYFMSSIGGQIMIQNEHDMRCNARHVDR